MNLLVILGLLLMYTGCAFCGVMPFYRYYKGSDHFYTTQEAHGTLEATYHIYGRENPPPGSVPLYEYYSSEHFYTTNHAEIGTTKLGDTGRHGYVCLGVAGYCHPSAQPGTIPLYRLYNGKVHDHFYCTDINEAAKATSQHGYVLEGVACYIPA